MMFFVFQTDAVMKTEWRNEEMLAKFCDEFFKPFVSNSGTLHSDGECFAMAITYLPLINPWNIELSNKLIDYIYTDTGCRVFCPPKEKFCEHPPSYFIQGMTAASVLHAARLLSVCSLLILKYYRLISQYIYFLQGLTMFQV